jgi:DNA invertase Pin-like site-specific DNA recombinase
MTARKAAKARRVVGYVRISRDRENETSTDSQRAAIEAYCAAQGWQVVKIVVEPGRSAFKSSRSSRPGFREVMNLVTTGAANTVVVWKLDRLARNTLDLLRFVEDLEQHGSEFASVTEQFDTSTPMGQAMLTIVAALAQLESAQKSERATEWHHHRRLNGAVPAGPAALGYVKPAPNELVPDPKVAPLVRKAAKKIAAGASVLSAVKELNAAGVAITHRGLMTALRSPTLVGMVAVSDGVLPRRGGARVLDAAELVRGPWKPILDRETWEQVRAVLDGPDRRTNSGNRLRWPLVPVVRCHCGSTMRHHVEKWTTKSGPRSMGRLLCTDQGCLNGIGYDAVEEAVTAAVLDLLDDETWNRVRASSRGETVDVAAVEERLQRMWAMVLDGKIEPEEYAEAKARWAGELAAATTEPVDLPDVEDLRASWPDLDPADRLLVFRAAVRSLTIGPANRRGGRGVDLSRVDLELV